MELRVLAVGDVVGASGLKHLEKHLRSVKRLYGVDFCVVNGENASGVGLTPQQADAMLDAGADVITLGNHTWNRREICPYLDDSAYILRPANFQPSLPGRGWPVYISSQVAKDLGIDEIIYHPINHEFSFFNNLTKINAGDNT